MLFNQLDVDSGNSRSWQVASNEHSLHSSPKGIIVVSNAADRLTTVNGLCSKPMPNGDWEHWYCRRSAEKQHIFQPYVFPVFITNQRNTVFDFNILTVYITKNT